MLRLLSDENFNGEIVRGLFRAHPTIDLVRVQDVGLSAADDSAILALAAENSRVLLTHDIATMPGFAYARVSAGQPMPGVFIVNDRAAIGQSIDDVLLYALYSKESEWEGQVLYL
jgi:predicted nuclease of predicted toxin-antitoxin system